MNFNNSMRGKYISMSLLMLFVPTVGLENIYLTHLLLFSRLVNTHYIYLSFPLVWSIS